MAILLLYNHNPLLFLNARYTGVTSTFSTEGLSLVTNVQLLNAFCSEMSDL